MAHGAARVRAWGKRADARGPDADLSTTRPAPADSWSERNQDTCTTTKLRSCVGSRRRRIRGKVTVPSVRKKMSPATPIATFRAHESPLMSTPRFRKTLEITGNAKEHPEACKSQGDAEQPAETRGIIQNSVKALHNPVQSPADFEPHDRNAADLGIGEPVPLDWLDWSLFIHEAGRSA